MAKAETDVTKAKKSIVGAEIGQPGYELASSFIKKQQDTALNPKNRWDTYQEMSVTDGCITEALTASQTLLFIRLFLGRYESSEYETKTSQSLADYMNHNILSMPQTHWSEACQNFVTHVKNGVSLSEIVSRKATVGAYRGNYELVKMGFRTPSSIYAWVWDRHYRDPVQVVQKPLTTAKGLLDKRQTSSYLGNITDVHQHKEIIDNRYPVLSVGKLVHMKFRPEGPEPMGNSPLDACFVPYQEKQLLNKYQVIGVTRDMGGTPILYGPNEFFQNAKDPNHPDARYMQELKTKMSNMHAGKDNHMFMASDVYDGTSHRQWDMRFLGVEGGGKQFDITDIIATKNQEIFSAFSASYLNAGKDGTAGSYNNSSLGFNIHSLVIERDTINCVAELDSLARRMITASGLIDSLNLSYKDMPRFVPANIDKLSEDEYGKLIQRLGSVMKLTPQMLKFFTKQLNCPIEGIDDLDFTDKGENRGGEGQGTSGTGSDTQSNSELNLDNKSALHDPYNVIQDGEYLVDVETDKPLDLKGNEDG